MGLIATKEKEPAVYRGFQVGVGTKFMKATTQENVHVVQTVEPIYHKDRIIGVFIVEQKMEQVIHTQKLNEVSSDEYDATLIDENSNIVDNIEEGLLFVDNSGKIIFRNRAAANIFKRLLPDTLHSGRRRKHL